MPVNAMLDLALLDGLNPAPLAVAGWQASGLEVPVATSEGTIVCDVVLFNADNGHLLAVEAKSGANIEPDQARKLTAIDPQGLILAGGITVPKPVLLRCEPLYVCLDEHSKRIMRGLSAIGLDAPVLAVDEREARLVNPSAASSDLAAAIGEQVRWGYPIASIIRFDQQSPEKMFDQPVRAELIAGIAQGRTAVTVRALTEQVIPHFAIYGRRAQGQLVRLVASAARRAAATDPDRLTFQPQTGNTEARIIVVRSPEEYDRRGRTQGYQAILAERGRSRARPEAPEQLDLFSVLDDAERVTSEEVYETVSEGSDDIAARPARDEVDGLIGPPPGGDSRKHRPEGGKRDDEQG